MKGRQRYLERSPRLINFKGQTLIPCCRVDQAIRVTQSLPDNTPSQDIPNAPSAVSLHTRLCGQVRPCTTGLMMPETRVLRCQNLTTLNQTLQEPERLVRTGKRLRGDADDGGNASYVSGTRLCSYASSSFILLITEVSEETVEAQRGGVVSPRPRSTQGSAGFNAGRPPSKPLALLCHPQSFTWVSKSLCSFLTAGGSL